MQLGNALLSNTISKEPGCGAWCFPPYNTKSRKGGCAWRVEENVVQNAESPHSGSAQRADCGEMPFANLFEKVHLQAVLELLHIHRQGYMSPKLLVFDSSN